ILDWMGGDGFEWYSMPARFQNVRFVAIDRGLHQSSALYVVDGTRLLKVEPDSLSRVLQMAGFAKDGISYKDRDCLEELLIHAATGSVRGANAVESEQEVIQVVKLLQKESPKIKFDVATQNSFLDELHNKLHPASLKKTKDGSWTFSFCAVWCYFMTLQVEVK